MKTIQINLTIEQAENLYYCVSHSCVDALCSDCNALYEALESLKKSLQAQGLAIVMN